MPHRPIAYCNISSNSLDGLRAITLFTAPPGENIFQCYAHTHAAAGAGTDGHPWCWRWWERRQQPASARGPGRPPSRGRAFRGSPARCFLQPVLCMGPYRPPVPSGSSLVCPLRRGPPDVQPPVPCRVVPRQAGPCKCTCGGQVQELPGTAPLPGQRALGEEGGPTGGQGVEVTLPTTQGAQGVSPS